MPPAKSSPSPKLHFSALLETQVSRLATLLPDLNPKCPRRLIHDIRVLTRRLRAAVSALENTPEGASKLKDSRKTLKKLGKDLSPIRSLDVLSSQLKKLLEAMPAKQREALAFCEKVLKAKRKTARKRLKKTPNKISEQFAKVKIAQTVRNLDVTRFAASLQQRASEETRDLLLNWRAFEKSGKLVDLHQVRIHLKKWKYLMEIQNFFLPPKRKMPVEQLKKLQDQLGRIRDRQVLSDELKTHAVRKAAPRANHRKALDRWTRQLEAETNREVAGFRKSGQPLFISQMIARSA